MGAASVSLPGEVRNGPLRGLKGICIDENQVLELKEEVETIDGVWDLPMIGSERLNVEHEYQKRTNGPEVTFDSRLSGTFLRADDGRFVNSKSISPTTSSRRNEHPEETWQQSAALLPCRRPANGWRVGRPHIRDRRI